MRRRYGNRPCSPSLPCELPQQRRSFSQMGPRWWPIERDHLPLGIYAQRHQRQSYLRAAPPVLPALLCGGGMSDKCQVCGETEIEGDLGVFDAEMEDGTFVIAILETSPRNHI